MQQAIEKLAARGFDIAHPFDLALVPDDDAFAMVARDAQRRVGLLIGNTRALWPQLVAALRADPALAAARDPLDTYAERVLGEVFPDEPVVFGHRRYGRANAFVPMQRLAELAGLAARATTGLCIHPTYGPWFALRGVVMLVGDPPCSASIASPCPATICARACTAALARAMSAKHDGDAWRAWLAMRDTCTVGREHRYSDAQVRYHYTKDRSSLR